MGIPYQAIGIGLAFLLGIRAFIEADTTGGRVFITATMILLFLLPEFWRSKTASLISFILCMVFAFGCYIFLRYRGVGIR